MQALQYRIVFKAGKVQLELVNCAGPVCDPNADRVRQFLGLGQASVIAAQFKFEYAEETAATEAGAIAVS